MNTDSLEGQLEALCDVRADYCSSLIKNPQQQSEVCFQQCSRTGLAFTDT